jgi:hypothetical protein
MISTHFTLHKNLYILYHGFYIGLRSKSTGIRIIFQIRIEVKIKKIFLKAQNRAREGSVEQWSQVRITLMRSRIRIRIRIKEESNLDPH